MNLISIASSYLKSRIANTTLNITLMALGVMMMTILVLFGSQMQQRLAKDGSNIDVVVGAKGSPLQLILSTIWHMDIPTGNISLDDVKKIEHNPSIKRAIPISLGDNFRGFRIVGSSHSYLENFDAKIANGRVWNKSMEAVIGFEVAKKSNIKIGDKFFGSHGLVAGGDEHKDSAYEVVGILAQNNSVIDRLVITSLESVWDIHSHHDEDDEDHASHNGHKDHHDHESKTVKNEITALLISYKNYAAAMNFPRYINQNTNLQAASPAFEMARLTNLIGVGSDTLFIFGCFLVAISLISVLIGLINSVRERIYDLTVFRILGANKKAIFKLVIIEGMIIAIIGTFIGLILGHLSLELIGNFTIKGQEMALQGFIFVPQLYLISSLLLVFSFLVCLIPAIECYIKPTKIK